MYPSSVTFSNAKSESRRQKRRLFNHSFIQVILREYLFHPVPNFDLIFLREGLDGVVDDVVSGGGADVDLGEVRRPLADHEREALPARRRRRRPRQHQLLHVPRGQADEAGVGDLLAAADVQQPQLVRLFEQPLDLAVLHALEVAAAVHRHVDLAEVGEARRLDLLLHRRLREADHGVVGVQDAQLRAALLELFHVQEDGVARRRGDVGDVELLEVAAVARDRLEDERQAGHLVVGDVEVGEAAADDGDEVR